MQIKHTFTSKSTGETCDAIYYDASNISEVGDRKVYGVQAYCFFEDKIVIVYSNSKGYWSIPGGGVESGETAEEAIFREIKEETNMQVTSHKLLGFQDVFRKGETHTHVRFFCTVTPYGDFEKDPDGEVTKIEFIDPKDLTQYVNWGDAGRYQIEKAIEMYEKIKI